MFLLLFSCAKEKTRGENLSLTRSLEETSSEKKIKGKERGCHDETHEGSNNGIKNTNAGKEEELERIERHLRREC
jgi:hypothetical protein